MATIFDQWAKRATDGTSDLFWMRQSILVHKDRKGFNLSIFDTEKDDFALYQRFDDRESWKQVYRLARVVIRHGKSNLRDLSR